MSESHPRFKLGDMVREAFPFATAHRERGMVMEAYKREGGYRYVVKFESGREAVFFESELIPDISK